MSDESETPESEHNEKAIDYKRYGIGAAMFVGGAIAFFFLLSSINGNKKESEPTIEVTPPTASTRKSSPSFEEEVFEEVGKNRKPAEDSTLDTEGSVPNYRNSAPQLPNLTPDLVEQEVTKHDALEMKRALLSSRSSWGMSSPTQAIESTRDNENKSDHLNTPPSTPLPDNLLSSDKQRQMIAKRLAEAEALKQRILKGDTSTLNQSQSQLANLESSFSEPPSNIVGFTKENRYNASTEGLLKLPIGTLIPAITSMKTNSDYSGSFKGTVSQDVFDVSGEYVLIPKGSQVILKSVSISNINEPISSRMGITVPWVVLPNGNKIDLSKSTGMDREGISALKDSVDRHLVAQFFGVAAYALVATETSRDGTGDSDSSYAGEIGEGLRSQASPLAQKYLSLSPTITLRAGQSMNIMIEEEVYLSPWCNIYEDYL
ncbi:TrbI/VirB10 family protein [Aliivibrio fischeri]|uniref:TrbI/VirB10 family protein n=1 Tax=Aliivibrio fischeri TaxID=668 RepID=UPI00301360EC